MAQIRHNKETIHLGSYYTEEDAAKAYDEAARRLFGAFACTNQKTSTTNDNQNGHMKTNGRS